MITVVTIIIISFFKQRLQHHWVMAQRWADSHSVNIPIGWALRWADTVIIVDDLSPIKQQRNTELKIRQWKRKRRRFTTSKQSPHNQETQDLTYFDSVPISTEKRGEIFIENREENTRVIRRSLSQHSIVKFWNSLEFLTHFQKPTPMGFI